MVVDPLVTASFVSGRCNAADEGRWYRSNLGDGHAGSMWCGAVVALDAAPYQKPCAVVGV